MDRTEKAQKESFCIFHSRKESRQEAETLILRIIQVEATSRGHSDQHLLLQAETSPRLDHSQAVSKSWMIKGWEGQDLVEFRG